MRELVSFSPYLDKGTVTIQIRINRKYVQLIFFSSLLPTIFFEKNNEILKDFGLENHWNVNKNSAQSFDEMGEIFVEKTRPIVFVIKNNRWTQERKKHGK